MTLLISIYAINIARRFLKRTMKVIIAFLAALSSAQGLRCYICSRGPVNMTDRCVINPMELPGGSPSVECSARYCTITRQEYKDPAGQIASFFRGCENNPVHLNSIIDDDDFKTYYRSCNKDLCNAGNGIQLIQNGDNGIGYLLIPGRGRNIACSVQLSSVIVYTMMIFAIIMNIKSFVL